MGSQCHGETLKRKKKSTGRSSLKLCQNSVNTFYQPLSINCFSENCYCKSLVAMSTVQIGTRKRCGQRTKNTNNKQYNLILYINPSEQEGS